MVIEPISVFAQYLLWENLCDGHHLRVILQRILIVNLFIIHIELLYQSSTWDKSVLDYAIFTRIRVRSITEKRSFSFSTGQVVGI